MTKKQIINKTAEYIKKKMSGDASGHDWWHVYRVWQLAKAIGKNEKADMFVVELGALLHDIADFKFNNGDEEIGPRKAASWLKKLKVDKSVILNITDIIKEISFKGALVKISVKTLEGRVVQDADRLDAIGAIGIARGFMFAGNKNLPMYDPLIKPLEINNFETYKNLKRKSYTQINHFYEKLLLLKDLMNTKTACKIAINRHKFMKKYLREFYAEWDGKK